MRICMLTSGHSPLDDRIFHKEALTLKQEYGDITIIAQYQKEWDMVDGIRIIGIPGRKNGHLKNRMKTLALLYRKGLEAHADIYHCHEPDALYIGTKLRRKLNSGLIYDSHEYHPETFALHFKGIARKLIRYLVYRGEMLLVRKCDWVITVNRILEERFKKYNSNVLQLPNYPRLALIPGMTPARAVQPAQTEGGMVSAAKAAQPAQAVGVMAPAARSKEMVPPSEEDNGNVPVSAPVPALLSAPAEKDSGNVPLSPGRDLRGLVYAGGICEEKGCKKMIEAVNRSKHCLNMSFIGTAAEGFKEAVAGLMVHSRRSHIKFAGTVEHTGVFEQLQRNVIGFVLNQPLDPADANCQPIKLFEYMAAGIAVIAGDYPLIREVVEAERCGLLVDPTDEGKIAGAVDAMIENMDETLAMGERGRRAVMEKYNWESMEQSFLKIYREMGQNIYRKSGKTL